MMVVRVMGATGRDGYTIQTRPRIVHSCLRQATRAARRYVYGSGTGGTAAPTTVSTAAAQAPQHGCQMANLKPDSRTEQQLRPLIVPGCSLSSITAATCDPFDECLVLDLNMLLLVLQSPRSAATATNRFGMEHFGGIRLR